MVFWFDISNISTFKGGVVGIVRAELELAYNFATIDPSIRFCKIDSSKSHIQEVTRSELSWLLNAGAPVEGFLARNASVLAEIDSPNITPHIKNFRTSVGRMEHLRQGANYFISVFPRPIANMFFNVLSPAYRWLKKSKYIKSNRKNHLLSTSERLSDKTPNHPFQAGDVVFAAGWMDNDKEAVYKKIKAALNQELYLSYLIYDTILVNPKTASLYNAGADIAFQRYFNWISNNCDLIFYGGKTAQDDSQSLQKKLHLPVPEGYPIRFGDTPNSKLQPLTDKEALTYFETLGIKKNQYLLCVGSVEPRKNHDVLYKAYREILDHPNKYPNLAHDTLPKVVIAGGTGYHSYLLHSFKNDPKVSEYFVFVRPSDEELNALYKETLFTLMPTMYEGWNLTLPESLTYGKFCLSSAVAPMVEIGKNLIDYADMWDATEWAKLIEKYTTDSEALKGRERQIQSEWKNYSWHDCASSIYTKIKTHQFKRQENTGLQELWFDLTLVKNWLSRPEGIPRVELSLAWELYNKVFPNIRFFTHYYNEKGSHYVEVDVQELPWLHKGRAEYADFYYQHQQHFKLSQANMSGAGTSPLASTADQAIVPIVLSEPSRKNRLKKAALHLISVLPIRFTILLYKYKRADLRDSPTAKLGGQTMCEGIQEMNVVEHPFCPNDTILSAGIDWESKYLQGLNTLKKVLSLRSGYFIYDMVPLLEPQFYDQKYPVMYKKMFSWVSHTSDIVFCGGQTALNDALFFQEKLQLPHPKMHPLKLGVAFNEDSLKPQSLDETILKKLGVKGRYVLSVGTIQIRKNHEVLYRTLVRWLEDTPDEAKNEIPMFVFAGKPGWQVDHLMSAMTRDKRVAKHLLLITPSDEELSILYRNCMFTLLPSYYEGYSLTLPESLAYGKFCLTSDSPPLREAGQDFADYLNPRDVGAWLDAIKRYVFFPEMLKAKEQHIAQHKSFVSWNECAVEMIDFLKQPKTENIK